VRLSQFYDTARRYRRPGTSKQEAAILAVAELTGADARSVSA
jgi:hypothetical protein